MVCGDFKMARRGTVRSSCVREAVAVLGSAVLVLTLSMSMLTRNCLAVSVPSTLDGPQVPSTGELPEELRNHSMKDLRDWHYRVVKRAAGISPDQIFLQLSTPDAMWVSWVTGNVQLGPQVTPLDPTSVRSVVLYGKERGNYTASVEGVSLVYSQLYPFEKLLNYTSGIIHHVQLTGLEPGSKYYYICGDPSLDTMSKEKSFTTMPAPGPENYPARIGVIGDMGLTYDSLSTFDHLRKNKPDLVLLLGDMAYADMYGTNGSVSSCYDCSLNDTPIRESYQPRWDSWQRLVQSLTSKTPSLVVTGNHEVEVQIDKQLFTSYKSRFATTVGPEERSSPSNTSLYYSVEAGGIHFIVLSSYVKYNRSDEQYLWLEADLKKVTRSVTPWMVALMHAPWYNSYNDHYREAECMMQSMEAILYEYGVDVIFTGHVHAYERSNRVYNYQLDPCGIQHITIGDGGNIEGITLSYADQQCPDPATASDYFGSCAANFTSGPAAGKHCWTTQPEWSAYREPSFGHGIIEVMNSTHLLWTWHRNQDTYDSTNGDQIYIVRQPTMCKNQQPHLDS